ncbi:MAG: adenosylcobinamide-GDP ribazoletransferase [Candidatus Humimicrobiaceae bacterium]
MRNFLNSIGFLTIIKIPDRYCLREGFYRTLTFFPLTGLIVGVFLALAFWVFNLFLPAILAVVLVVGFEAIITGGMHYDGLSDVFDGIFSGKTGQGIYRIMKKSDIGVFGVLAILFSVILRIGFTYYLYILTEEKILVFYMLLAFMPVFGKWSMVYILSFYRPVKKQSLSGLFESGNNKRRFIWATTYTVIAFLIFNFLLEVFFNGSYPFIYKSFVYSFLLAAIPLLKALVIFLLAYLALMVFSRFFTSKIGGLNGDIVGATSQIVEISYLAITIILFSFF